MDPDDAQRLFVSPGQGVWRSEDRGRSWQALPSVGLGQPVIRHLLAIPGASGDLLAATSAGLFLYTAEWHVWRPITLGLPTRDIRRLAWSPGDRTVWAATALGAIPVSLPPPVPSSPVPSVRQILPEFGHEPTIEEVQAAAIQYAEVMPEKIARWRARAAWRGLVPTFTLGLDRDLNTTIGSSSSNGKTNFTVGPNDRSVSVDMGFTWNLADLVWNDDQTSIDVRSRLMVQLRGDVLDEVTRLYYERRRLQVEYALNAVQDPALRLERQLRLEELAAQIDALTNGIYRARMRPAITHASPLKEESHGASRRNFSWTVRSS